MSGCDELECKSVEMCVTGYRIKCKEEGGQPATTTRFSCLLDDTCPLYAVGSCKGGAVMFWEDPELINSLKSARIPMVA